MSADTGPRKRNKDKKRKKGSITETNIPGPIIVQKDVQTLKLLIDENMHVQKDTKFGGNLLSKFIFFFVFLAIGTTLFFVLIRNSSAGDDESDSLTSWLPQKLNFLSFFYSTEPIENFAEANAEKEEISGIEAESSFFENLWDAIAFFRDSKTASDLIDDEKSNSLDKNSIKSINLSNNDEIEDILDDDNDDNDDDDDEINEDDYENDDDQIEADYDEPDNEEEDDSKKKAKLFSDPNGNYLDNNDDDEEEREDGEELNDEEDLNNLQKLDRIPREYNFKNGKDSDENDDPNFSNNDDDDEEEDDNHLEEELEDESFNQRDDSDHEGYSEDSNTNVEENSEPTITNVVTKLGVGIALIFVAYSVIIRKWDDYEDLVPPSVDYEEFNIEDDLSDIENDSSTSKQPLQYSYDANQLTQNDVYENKNEISLSDSEAPTESESEDAVDNVMQWSGSNSANILADEVGDSESETSEQASDNSDTDSDDLHGQYLSQDYEKANITNNYDWQFKDELDQADQDFDNHRFTDSLDKYNQILQTHPQSARAKVGVAKSMDAKAEQQKSNKLLDFAVEAYVDALFAMDMPDALFIAAAERVINRMHFRGQHDSCVTIQNFLIERFPNSVRYQNDLVVSLLTLNRMSEAKKRLEQILISWPNNGFGLVHYGFVLKMEGNLSSAIEYLRKGIETNEDGTQDGRFYYHLGDALLRLGRSDEATRMHRIGAKRKVFLSEYQRSLYNVGNLTGRAWWTLPQTTYESFFIKLQDHWKTIRDEGLLLLKLGNTPFAEESEQLRETGDWKQFELFSRAAKRSQCHRAPITCKLIGEFPPAAGCRRGQTKFSVMEPGTHVRPHCGPTNCRLRAHLGLVVPSNVSIRVASETRQWKEGEILIFDDSFEHEVWHNGTSSRLILIIDVWHPELSAKDRKTLSPI